MQPVERGGAGGERADAHPLAARAKGASEAFGVGMWLVGHHAHDICGADRVRKLSDFRAGGEDGGTGVGDTCQHGQSGGQSHAPRRRGGERAGLGVGGSDFGQTLRIDTRGAA